MILRQKRLRNSHWLAWEMLSDIRRPKINLTARIMSRTASQTSEATNSVSLAFRKTYLVPGAVSIDPTPISRHSEFTESPEQQALVENERRAANRVPMIRR